MARLATHPGGRIRDALDALRPRPTGDELNFVEGSLAVRSRQKRKAGARSYAANTADLDNFKK